MGCTLPRAPAVRALSEGSEGQQQGSFSGCWAAQTQRRTENTGLPGPLAGVWSPGQPKAVSVCARECMTDVGSLALSSPAETCAGFRGLILRVWVPAHSTSSWEAAPEARSAGGALRPRLIGEGRASREGASSGEEEAAQPRQAESPACTEPSAPPLRQSSSSAQRPDLAELLALGPSAMGEPCPDLPCF